MTRITKIGVQGEEQIPYMAVIELRQIVKLACEVSRELGCPHMQMNILHGWRIHENS